ncbi:MAG: DNA translocase FtsK [Acidimicrobiales bacterium]|nr:DNA translocase FtsK [Acidimicrobiales bacterium]
MQNLAATWGTVLVLLAMGLVSFLLLTGTPMSVVAEWCSTRLQPLLQRSPGLREADLDPTLFDANGDPRVVDAGTGEITPQITAQADEPAAEEESVYIDLSDRAESAREPEPEEPAVEAEESGFDTEAIKPFVNVPNMETAAPAEPDLDVRPPEGSSWVLPPMALLSRSASKQVDTGKVEARGRLLEAALAEHGVETRLVGMTVGPTVTRFELELGRGVKVSKVTSLQNDIAYAMASPDVRILAPIPGRQAIGVEVPNTDRDVVAVGDILASDEARKATHPLEVAVGRDINGRSIMMNLATMPHILIAGQTGAGKSSGLNSIITSIMMRATPDQVRMVLIDPKRVEMGQYDRIPHLLTAPVTDPKKAANALAWAVREMERRYDLLSEVGFRDITGYNAAVEAGEIEPKLGELDDDGTPKSYRALPFILVVVDELADLMMVAARDVEESVCRLAQMARAVGIHLVIATQRPSVNVITGLIKANVPARIAFKVSSLTDSRVILDQQGAERLVGRGDLLMQGPSSATANRIQGCWVEESEVRKIVKHWRAQAQQVTYDDGVAVDGSGTPARASVGAATGGEQLAIEVPPQPVASITDDRPAGFAGGDEDDELLMQAVELVVNSQLGSTSMLQRKLRVGFARAGRLMDLLEEKGVVGPSEGSKARAVNMSPEQLEQLKAQM